MKKTFNNVIFNIFLIIAVICYLTNMIYYSNILLILAFILAIFLIHIIFYHNIKVKNITFDKRRICVTVGVEILIFLLLIEMIMKTTLHGDYAISFIKLIDKFMVLLILMVTAISAYGILSE